MAVQWQKLIVAGILASSVVGCTGSGEGAFPTDVPDPSALRTPNGAVALYRGALKVMPQMFSQVLLTSGVLTDELMALPLTLGVTGPYTDLDSRQKPFFNPKRVHQVRTQTREARGFLAAYAPDSSPALRGHMYAIEGYAVAFLADLFCSGIPLSTVDFDGNYTLAKGSTTTEAYEQALALFDSALATTSDSVRLQSLAAVGRGRTLLALGRYSDAAAAVAAVPDNYRYDALLGYTTTVGLLPDSAVLWWLATRTTSPTGSSQLLVGAPSVGDQEGTNGLNYRTSNDPRTLAVAKGRDRATVDANTFFFPRKYTSGSSTATNPGLFNPAPLLLASGIEARLIEAEATLQAGSADWLVKLNQLRQGTACGLIVPATTCPLVALDDPGASLSDPAAAMAARVDLLFRERAFWLYLTAHRQGDLRRLIRQYQRAQSAVYPKGFYSGSSGVYGSEVVVPMPDEEQLLNPNYTGCVHRNA